MPGPYLAKTRAIPPPGLIFDTIGVTEICRAEKCRRNIVPEKSDLSL